jgi:hypothetical protein
MLNCNAAKLSHQFPVAEEFFVSQINKSRQKKYPKRSKQRANPRRPWLCELAIKTLRLFQLL